MLSDAPPAASRRRTLRRLFSLARPEARPLAFATVFLLVSAVGNLAFPWVAGRLLDEALFGSSEAGVHLDRVDRLAEWALVIFAATALASALRFVLFSSAGERIVARLRADFFAHLLHQEIGFFDEEKTGELANRLSSDTSVLETAVTTYVSVGLRNAAQALGGLAMLCVTSVKLTLLMLAVVPPVALAAMWYGRRVQQLSRASQDVQAEASELAVEALEGIRTVRSFAAEGREVERYRASLAQSLTLAFRGLRFSGSFFGVASFAALAAAVLVFWSGARMIAAGSLTGGSVVFFFLCSMQVAYSVSSFAELWTETRHAAGAAERVFELLDRQPAVRLTGGRTLAEVVGAIRFEQVEFAYPSRLDAPVLKALDLEVAAGSTLALVGLSGAGKSTIASLLYRLYEPARGTISLDGHPLTALDPSWLRRQVGVVAQEPVLFSGSIAENIRYGSPGVSDSEVEAAARLANAHEFIAALPMQYQTLIGERGVRLSGGQRQRVAIARAILKNPRILILDEATSALDAESEQLVKEALGRIKKGRTTLIIAHRLSTVMDADRVAVIEAGRIGQAGTHDSLLAEAGPYRRLVERQFAIS